MIELEDLYEDAEKLVKFIFDCWAGFGEYDKQSDREKHRMKYYTAGMLGHVVAKHSSKEEVKRIRLHLQNIRTVVDNAPMCWLNGASAYGVRNPETGKFEKCHKPSDEQFIENGVYWANNDIHLSFTIEDILKGEPVEHILTEDGLE